MLCRKDLHESVGLHSGHDHKTHIQETIRPRNKTSVSSGIVIGDSMDCVRLDIGPDANITVLVAIDTETGVGMVTSLGIDVARYKYLRGYLKKLCLKGPLYVFSYDR